MRIGAPRVVQPLVEEVVKRPQLAQQVNMSEAHMVLASVTEDDRAAFAYAGKARELAVARGESAAPWMLDELSMRIMRHDVEGAQQLLRQIQVRYQRDANVMQALAQLLVRLGVISQDGTPTRRGSAAAEAAPAPAAAAAPASKLWTPETAAAPAASEGKSKLWLPGME
jgi:hypothetical protein